MPRKRSEMAGQSLRNRYEFARDSRRKHCKALKNRHAIATISRRDCLPKRCAIAARSLPNLLESYPKSLRNPHANAAKLPRKRCEIAGQSLRNRYEFARHSPRKRCKALKNRHAITTKSIRDRLPNRCAIAARSLPKLLESYP